MGCFGEEGCGVFSPGFDIFEAFLLLPDFRFTLCHFTISVTVSDFFIVMHPLISLISFVVFSAFVSLGQAESSIVGILLLLVVWLVSRQAPKPKAWMMIKRLRIFFFSIFIMYLWFTPGQLIWPPFDTWSPTYDGLAQGAQRIIALIILVLGVETLLRLLDRAELLVALYYLATPLQHVGVNRDRFIVRVLLTLEAVEQKPVQDQVSQFGIKNINSYLGQISQRLADEFNLASGCVEDNREVAFEIKALPNWIQWLIPFMIATLFLSLNGINLS